MEHRHKTLWATGLFQFEEGPPMYIDVCACGAVRAWAHLQHEDGSYYDSTSWQVPPKKEKED